MLTLLELGLSSFLLCLCLTPLCRDLFVRFGLVDRPDADRKFHLRAVPRIGGLPIAISYTLSLALVTFLNPGSGRLYIQHKQLFLELLPAAGLVFLTGLLDDIFGLKPRQKLFGQIVAAFLAVSFGTRIDFLHLPLWASFVLSFCWLIGCTNAFNLIDGMDGLASGISLIACLTTAGVAFYTGNYGLALATLPLAGALLAFLRYNFNPATVFLGDCGSLTIGFVLGCFSLIWSQHVKNPMELTAPLLVIALPLIDVCLAIARRFLRRKPIFQGDRGHIHHMVLGLGFSTRGATLVLYAVCVVCAGLAVMANFAGISQGWLILVFFGVLVMFGIDRLGYVEWHAAQRSLKKLSVRSAVQEEIYLFELDRSLMYADSIDACWDIVRKVCWDLQFVSASMELMGSTYSEEFLEHSDESGSRIQLHFGANDYLMLARSASSTTPRMMYTVLDHLQSAISVKVHSFEYASDSLSTNAA